MHDVYSFSQIVKKHPQYSLHRDEIHLCYQRLGSEQKLSCVHLQEALEAILIGFESYFLLCQDEYHRLEEEADLCRKKGYQFVTYGEETFPFDCYFMQEPPLTLSYLGEPAWISAKTLSVVGSREPCEISLQWMEKEFAKFCEEREACIVSGGARGIDQKAHSLAIRKKCSTVVVLPSGLDRLYPGSLLQWVEPVLSTGGCFVSEYSPQQVMHKYLFHHRNRLIAALGQASLLIEARRRSGTLITAQQALQLGRSVGVIGGHPLDPHFGGSLDLLCEGAQMIRDAQDLVIFFDVESELKKPQDALVVGSMGLDH